MEDKAKEKSFTYTIELRGDRVYGTGLDQSGREMISPKGAFRYEGERRSQIDSLSQRAMANTNPLTEGEVQKLGQALFEALFDEEHQSPFLSFWETHRHTGLIRVELDIDEVAQPDVAALPWEFLQIPPNQVMRGRFLATDPTITFVRRRRRLFSPPAIQLAPAEQLSLIVAVAPLDPETSGLVAVDYEGTCQTLQALATENPARLATPRIINPATETSIDDSLRAKPHLFHFIGHGRLHNDAGEPEGLVGILGDLGTQWVNAGAFANLLTRNSPPLILLQACEGAASPLSNSMVGVAAHLLWHNVPVVIAMQYKVSNGIASKFVRKFYERLIAGDPVDQAVQEGRRTIAHFNRTRDFATPVIFMQVADGRLFEWEGGDPPPPIRDPWLDFSIAMHKPMNDAFNKSDLTLLCFYMGIKWEEFREGFSGFITDLINHCHQHKRLGELLGHCRQQRPRTVWPTPPSTPE